VIIQFWQVLYDKDIYEMLEVLKNNLSIRFQIIQ